MKHNWDYNKFSSLCNIVRGGSPRPIQDYLTDDTDGLNWIKIGDVAAGSKYITSTKEKIKKEGLVKTRQVFKGDFILSNSMSFGRPYILKIDGCIHDGWLAIKGVEDHFIADFLYYFLSSPSTYSLFEKLVKGGVVSNLNSDIVKGIHVPVPPMEVQEKIVAELDKINEVIEDCRELLRNLDALAQSLFYDTFGDPVTNPKGWEVRPLKNAVVEMFIGPFGSALKTDYYVSEEKAFAMVYEQKHAIKKTLKQDNHFIDEEKFLSLKRFEVIPYDFIMSCRGTIGQLYQVPENSPRGIIHPSLMKIRLNATTYNAVFFKYILPIVIKEQQTKGNCVQMAITAKELGAQNLPVPPLTLQEEFAKRIEAIEAIKATTQQQLAALQTLLDSRMDYWFN